MEWFPQAAMKAYLHTIQLVNFYLQLSFLNACLRLIEPKYIEFVSALAVGKRARLMQTGGLLICIGHEDDKEKSKALVKGNNLENVIKFVYGNPCEVIKQYKNIDFAVIDCKFQDHLKIFKTINLNPSGSTMVVNNFHHRKDGISFAEVVEGKRMHLTKIGSTSKPESRRFHVTYEN
ncbi:hypothetical protein RGQ29_002723 [Quercus rubra]|uniref:Uncharacterized protein n=1 Tax=Quercus rubra TaxID=3512 RepID=A0AAN7EAU6_QUERU|nr:hypothetical protein RGQ29_002723 [Quercus rubra]